MADTTKTLHNVTTERNYTNTRLIQMDGRIFKFHHEISNGTNRFTVELFDGDKFNFITGISGLGVQKGIAPYDVSYVSRLDEKQAMTKVLFNKGINFIKLLP